MFWLLISVLVWGLTRLRTHPCSLPRMSTRNFHGGRLLAENQNTVLIFLLLQDSNFWLILLHRLDVSLCPMTWNAFCTRKFYRNDCTLNYVREELKNSISSYGFSLKWRKHWSGTMCGAAFSFALIATLAKCSQPWTGCCTHPAPAGPKSAGDIPRAVSFPFFTRGERDGFL